MSVDAPLLIVFTIVCCIAMIICIMCIAQKLQTQQLQNQQLMQNTLRDTLAQNTQMLSQKVDNLTVSTEQKLQHMSTSVERRLSDSFEKTTSTFTNIAKRLALIDDAQQRLTDLSNNVISLQEILSDKRARGAFGETQLQQLIKNVLPSNSFAMQYQLKNGTRCDCMLFLPQPTGKIAIDAKFPLENFQHYVNSDNSETKRSKALQLFRQDIRKHILDIATKYIIPNETTDGAIMFIPAESVFAEIHCKLPDIVELSHQKHIWLASPTTMMAILTTASSVLKDTETRKHVHSIQQHLRMLAKDFERFDDRMLKLAKHIDMAHDDLKQVHASAKKISQRFHKIEQVELEEIDQA